MRFECRVRTSSGQQVKCNWRARAQWSQTGSYLQDVRCKTKQIPEWSSSMKPGIVKIERNKTYSQRNKKVIRCFDTNIVVWSRKTREQQIKFRRLQQSLHSPPFSPPLPPFLEIWRVSAKCPGTYSRVKSLWESSPDTSPTNFHIPLRRFMSIIINLYLFWKFVRLIVSDFIPYDFLFLDQLGFINSFYSLLTTE